MKMNLSYGIEQCTFLFFSFLFLSLTFAIVLHSAEILPLACVIPVTLFGIPFSLMVLFQLYTLRNRRVPGV